MDTGTYCLCLFNTDSDSRWFFEEAKLSAESCLEIRVELIPDSWLRYNAEAKLGKVLVQLKEFGKAKRLLVNGCAGMLARKKKVKASALHNLESSIQALIELSESQGDEDEEEKWRSELNLLQSEYGTEPVDQDKSKELQKNK